MGESKGYPTGIVPKPKNDPLLDAWNDAEARENLRRFHDELRALSHPYYQELEEAARLRKIAKEHPDALPHTPLKRLWRKAAEQADFVRGQWKDDWDVPEVFALHDAYYGVPPTPVNAHYAIECARETAAHLNPRKLAVDFTIDHPEYKGVTREPAHLDLEFSGEAAKEAFLTFDPSAGMNHSHFSAQSNLRSVWEDHIWEFADKAQWYPDAMRLTFADLPKLTVYKQWYAYKGKKKIPAWQVDYTYNPKANGFDRSGGDPDDLKKMREQYWDNRTLDLEGFKAFATTLLDLSKGKIPPKPEYDYSMGRRRKRP